MKVRRFYKFSCLAKLYPQLFRWKYNR
jgi:hypothetical protein